MNAGRTLDLPIVHLARRPVFAAETDYVLSVFGAGPNHLQGVPPPFITDQLSVNELIASFRRLSFAFQMELDMTFRKIFLAAAVLVLSAPVVPALAHDDEDNGGSVNRFLHEYGIPHSHGPEGDAHERYHEQLSDQHERAHDEGFESGAEHRAYHRALRDQHDDAHEYQAPRRQYRFYQED